MIAPTPEALDGITVSVVGHGHDDEIRHLLEDLARHAGASVREVILTLNLPQPRLADWIAAGTWPFEVLVLHNPVPAGFGANHNQAYARCRTSHFCVLNPDIRLVSDPFPPLLDALRDDTAGCAYPLQSTGQGEPVDRARELPTPAALLRRYLLPGYASPAYARRWVNGSFMLFKAAVFGRLQGFDPAFFMYCEDVDICLRMRELGFRLVVVPEVVVRHEAAHASRRRPRHLWWHLQSLARLWRSDVFKRQLERERGHLPDLIPRAAPAGLRRAVEFEQRPHE